MASEQEPFLAVKEEEKVASTKKAQYLRRPSSRWALCASFLLAQLALLAVYAIVTVWIITRHDLKVSSYSCG